MPAPAVHPRDLDANALARAFGLWLKKAASGNKRTRPVADESVFATDGSFVVLDATRASMLIRKGLDAGTVSELVDLLGIPKREDLGHALNANPVTLWRWARDNKPLPAATVEQILRSMQLQLVATDVFGSVEAARQWLQKPHPMLGGLSPSDFADNEFGAQKVTGMLAGLKYGSAA
jgi:putative toxin-antitoxin system antitoxin component (TIGR02293 family)